MSGWNRLLAIAREAFEAKEDEETRRPLACPNDGTVLYADNHGGLYCPWGCDYRWPS